MTDEMTFTNAQPWEAEDLVTMAARLDGFAAGFAFAKVEAEYDRVNLRGHRLSDPKAWARALREGPTLIPYIVLPRSEELPPPLRRVEVTMRSHAEWAFPRSMIYGSIMDGDSDPVAAVAALEAARIGRRIDRIAVPDLRGALEEVWAFDGTAEDCRRALGWTRRRWARARRAWNRSKARNKTRNGTSFLDRARDALACGRAPEYVRR